MDVDYVLVIFGGMAGYQSDDINKFLWFVRMGRYYKGGRGVKEKEGEGQ